MKQRIFFNGIISIGFSSLVLACSNPTSTEGDPRLSSAINSGIGEGVLSIYTTQQTYPLNTQVKVVVKNNAQQDVTIGTCFDLQYQTSAGWRNVSEEELPCAALGLSVKGKDSLVVNAGSSHTTAAGSYRLRFKVTIPQKASPADPNVDTTNLATLVLETIDVVSNVFVIK